MGKAISSRNVPNRISQAVSVPGRVNLIGEHIDYHGLSVLPIAIQHHVRISFERRSDGWISAKSEGHSERNFSLDEVQPFPAGDWGNYLKAAMVMVARGWKLRHGIDAAVESDLPEAAGLSSSSALLTGFALALLQANEICPTIAELMELLPEGEHYVGTRGGGMDHAAVVASRAGCALLVGFNPLRFENIPIPADWRFLVAHSLTYAEKSGAARVEYNQRRTAGNDALKSLGFGSYREALERFRPDELIEVSTSLPPLERDAFRHVTSEANRVRLATEALGSGNIRSFGQILNESHASLRDQLRVSNPQLDELVEAARASGATGARLTGAGFGGCAVILCRKGEEERISRELMKRFYSHRAGFDPRIHLLVAQPSAGVLGA